MNHPPSSINSFYKIENNYLLLNIKVVPGSSKSCFGEVNGDKLKIKIAAVPEDGKANDELISFLSKMLKVPKRDVEIISGEKSRIKILRLPAAAKDFFDRLL